MSKSELLEKYSKVIEMPASNIAFIFYNNLKKEKDNYTHIKVVIKLSDGKNYNHDYFISQLEIVKQKLNLFNNVSELMKEKDYNALFKLFDLSAATNLKEKDIENYCSISNKNYGQIIKTQFQGFSFFKTQNEELLQLSGIQQRDKQNIPISLFIDFKKKSTENSINTMKFEF